MAVERIVVSRRWTGLGDCIISLAAAWRYARATGRILAADWRRSIYDPIGANVFDDVFEPATAVAGVDLRSGDELSALYGDGPYWPPGWSAERIETASARGESGQTALAVERIRGGGDVDERVVVLDGCLSDAAPTGADARMFYEALQPRVEISRSAADFVRAHLGNQPVLAVHVRHGDGKDIMAHARQWANPGRRLFDLLRLIEATRRRMDERAGTEARVLLCTDSLEVQTAFATALSDLVTRPKAFLPPGTADVHQGAPVRAALFDAAVEMVLLEHADVLIRFPAGSFFSMWGATRKRALSIDISGLMPESIGARIC